MKYRAIVGLIVPVDDEEDARIRKLTVEGATEIPDRKVYRVEAGKIANYLPAGSIPWLLEGGYIKEVK